MHEIAVTVEPWPAYPAEGGLPVWNVMVETAKGIVALQWSMRLERFGRSWAAMNFRRGQPVEHRSAVQFMHDFCASVSLYKWDIDGSKNGTFAQNNGTQQRDNLARAGTLRVMSQCPMGHIGTGHMQGGTGHFGLTASVPSSPGPRRPMTWLHVMALNLIADHEAGVQVDPVKLETARRLVAA